MLVNVVAHSVFMPTSATEVASLVVQLLSPLEPAQERALLESCDLAHQHGDCVTPQQAAQEDTLRGSVEFTSETHVLLELKDSHPWRSLFASRQLVFRAEDAPEERAKAIGIALGILATSLTEERKELLAKEDPQDPQDTQLPQEEPEIEIEVSPRAEPTQEQPTPFEFAGQLGVNWSPSWPAAGPTGALQGRYFAFSNLGLQLDGHATGLLTKESDPALTALSVSLGPTLRFERGNWVTWLSVQGGLTWLQARLSDAQAQTPVGARTTPVLRAQWAGGLGLSQAIWLTLTPQATFYLTPTRVFIDGEQQGALTAGLFGVGLGLAWRPSQ